MPDTILLVEDDADLRDLLTYRLRREGYAVTTACDGVQALTLARTQLPNLVLLDLMLPKLDGLEVCKQLRASPATQTMPVVMLSGRTELEDRLIGLEVGADDYITKPFIWAELRIRLQTQLRRRAGASLGSVPTAGYQDILEVDTLRVDAVQHRVWREGQELALAKRLFALLVCFIRHCDQVLTRVQLLHQVWGADHVGEARTVDVHVRWLREKIERDPASPTLIQTVRGVGYRFTCPTVCHIASARR